MIIGLVSAVSVAGVLGLSYVGAYLLGHSRARREAELARRADSLDRDRVEDHVLAIEGAVTSMAQAIERLTDAQRIALLDRMRASPDQRPVVSRVPQHHTPA
jgi:hypothetical protein